MGREVVIMGSVDRPQHILVVEDDPTVSEVVARYLEREGFDVETVTNGHAALDRARARPPDAMILDLMLPGLDGLEVFRRLRSFAPTPVVMLTARGSEEDRVLGLELGADDYVSKPFSPRELTARLRSVLRRTEVPQGNGARVITAGDVTVDLSARTAHLGARPVSLTVREFDLLVFLMRNPRKAFTREQLLTEVWSWTFGDTSTVTVHVRRLREKLEPDPTMPRRIVTVWGVGYRYEPEAA